MKTISVRLTQEIWVEIERLSSEQGLKPGQIIRSMLLRMVRAKQQQQMEALS